MCCAGIQCVKRRQNPFSVYSISLWVTFRIWKLISLSIWGDQRYFHTSSISSCCVAGLPGQLREAGFCTEHWQVQALWTKALSKEMSGLKDQNAALPSTPCIRYCVGKPDRGGCLQKGAFLALKSFIGASSAAPINNCNCLGVPEGTPGTSSLPVLWHQGFPLWTSEACWSCQTLLYCLIYCFA